MTYRPLTSNEVTLRMLEFSRKLGEVTDRLDEADKEAVDAREDYTLAYAREFLRAEGAMEIRKQLTIERTHEARLRAETADQVVRGLKRQIETLKTRIEVGRSHGSAIKAEMAFAGSGMTP